MDMAFEAMSIGLAFIGLIALIEIYFEHKQKSRTNATLIWGVVIILMGFLQAISFLLPVDTMIISFIIAGVCIILARPRR
jgi:uncharacterized membrane protein